MKPRGLQKGFTIVELIVVIIVVAILATMIALSYNNAQIQSRDTAIRDAADKLVDTIRVVQTRLGYFPKGGTSSTTAASSTTGCIDGNGGYIWPGYTGVTCSIGDGLVAMGYLPPAFFTGLQSTNITQGGTNAQIFMVYQCGTSYYLFYFLENPSSAEQTSYSNATGASGPCVSVASTTNSAGMRAAKNLSSF